MRARGAVADGVEERHEAAGMPDRLAVPEDGFVGAGGGEFLHSYMRITLFFLSCLS